MKKTILLLALFPTMLLAQAPKKHPFKNVTYSINLYSSNENQVKQNAIQFGVHVPTKNNNVLTFGVTGERVREPNQKAQNDLSFNFSISGKSKK